MPVGIWEPEPSAPGSDLVDAPTVLAVHGITASHRVWASVAQRLPELRVIAPDLRGRGRSRDLPGPYGIAGHADDLARVMDHLEVPSAIVVGHSMGGFVTVATVARHSSRVAGVVLVDGGLPLIVPEGLTTDEVTAAILGPAQQRLSMTFADRDSYRRFFMAHPSFARWTDAITDYVDYDLVGEPGNYRAATRLEALRTDSRDLHDGGDWLPAGLAALAAPTPFLRAPLDLMNEEPGLFPAGWVDSWRRRFPSVDVREVPGANHYSLLFVDPGLAMIAAAVHDVLDAAVHSGRIPRVPSPKPARG